MEVPRKTRTRRDRVCGDREEVNKLDNMVAGKGEAHGRKTGTDKIVVSIVKEHICPREPRQQASGSRKEGKLSEKAHPNENPTRQNSELGRANVKPDSQAGGRPHRRG